MNLLRNGLLMRKTGDRRRTELTEGSASQCGFSVEFITRSRWASRVWALAFVSALAYSERYAKEQGKRHKKLTECSTRSGSSPGSCGAGRWRPPLKKYVSA
jgi:hypothetical protein